MNTDKTTFVPARATLPGILIQDEIDAREGQSQKILANQIGVQTSFLKLGTTRLSEALLSQGFFYTKTFFKA